MSKQLAELYSFGLDWSIMEYQLYQFNEFVDFNVTANVLADAGNRALGAIINKFKQINGLGITLILNYTIVVSVLSLISVLKYGVSKISNKLIMSKTKLLECS